MKIEIAKQDLTGALAQVNPSMASKEGGDDISGNYVFRAIPREDENAQNGAEVLACHGAMFSTAPLIGAVVSLDEGGPTMFTVEGKRLKQWLRVAADEALTLDYDADAAEVQVSRPDQSFESADPSKFRLWDGLVQGAVSKDHVKASHLKNGLLYAAKFVGEDRQKPEYGVVEARGGKLVSASYAAATLVVVPGLHQASLRVEGKDAPKLASFLDQFGDDDIEVLEHDRAVILKRDTGSLIGNLRPNKGFAKDSVIGQGMGGDHFWWELPVVELQRAITTLTSGADWSDSRLRLQQKGSTAILSMETKTGKTTSYEIGGLVSGTVEDAEPLPDKGVLVSHFTLSDVLSSWPNATFKMGFHRRKRGGYTRTLFENDGVEYLTVLAWLLDPSA